MKSFIYFVFILLGFFLLIADGIRNNLRNLDGQKNGKNNKKNHRRNRLDTKNKHSNIIMTNASGILHNSKMYLPYSLITYPKYIYLRIKRPAGCKPIWSIRSPVVHNTYSFSFDSS